MSQADLTPRLPDGTAVPQEALEWSFSRASGPGGQHVNKSSTKVRLRVKLELLPERVAAALRRRCGNRIDSEGWLGVAYGGTRSQLQNRQAAVHKLEELMRLAMRPRKRRIPTRVPRSVRDRRLESKKRRGRIKRSRGRYRCED